MDTANANAVWALGFACLGVLAAVVAERRLRARRLHRRRANKMFMAEYRAAFRVIQRDEPSPAPEGLPVIRSRAPVDAGRAPAPASAGPFRPGRHAVEHADPNR